MRLKTYDYEITIKDYGQITATNKQSAKKGIKRIYEETPIGIEVIHDDEITKVEENINSKNWGEENK
jgi:hypothetical protein